MRKRYLFEKIKHDLSEKIVLIGGPRQVGKTTLAKYVGGNYFPSFAYFNWDYAPDRKKIINYQFPGDSKLLIFDELHKYKQWKNYIKGIYDKYRETFSILVTGSAKMDIYRRGGDSLMGRYFHHILHPFSLAELLGTKNISSPFKPFSFAKASHHEELVKDLLRFGPFPEPFTKQDAVFWRRWKAERNDRLIKEDIRDLRMIGDLSSLQILTDLLPGKVGSPLSINNLSGDLQVAHKTVVNHLNILELFYFHFRIYPYTRKIGRSIKKMSKLYLWDWSEIQSEGAKFENFIASHLLKFAHFLQNAQGYQTKIYYLRDPDGKEVDFLFIVDEKPWFAVEAKLEKSPSGSLQYFSRKIQIPYLFQVIRPTGIDEFQEGIRVISADKFLTALV